MFGLGFIENVSCARRNPYEELRDSDKESQ